jgi:hypothetical protein
MVKSLAERHIETAEPVQLATLKEMTDDAKGAINTRRKGAQS